MRGECREGGGSWDISLILAEIQIRDNSGSHRMSRFGGGRKWWDSGHIFSVTGVANELKMQDERHRGVKELVWTTGKMRWGRL